MSVTSQPLMSIASANINKNVSPVKTTESQVKKPLGKGKAAKPIDKGKKQVAFRCHIYSNSYYIHSFYTQLEKQIVR